MLSNKYYLKRIKMAVNISLNQSQNYFAGGSKWLLKKTVADDPEMEREWTFRTKMPCPEMSRNLHHKRSASDIENGSGCSRDSLDGRYPGNLPSLSGEMKKMKIHENDDGSLPYSELFSSILSGDTFDSELDSCNTDYREDNLNNTNRSISSSSSSAFVPTLGLEHIENVFEQDSEGNNQLHKYISRHNSEAALDVIKLAPSFDYLSIENADGQTALHLAAVTNQPTLARSLICAGAVVDAIDYHDKTPLHLACELGHSDVVRCLLKPVDYTETVVNRYKIPFQRIPQNMELIDADGKTCLELAVVKGRFDIVHILIDSGAFIFPPGYRNLVLDIISRQRANELSHADNDDDESEEQDSEHGTLPFPNHHEESNYRGCRANRPHLLELDDQLSDKDLSIIRK